MNPTDKELLDDSKYPSQELSIEDQFAVHLAINGEVVKSDTQACEKCTFDYPASASCCPMCEQGYFADDIVPKEVDIVKPQSDQWVCGTCTFCNSVHLTKCEICNTGRK
jgi:hypothetical protein